MPSKKKINYELVLLFAYGGDMRGGPWEFGTGSYIPPIGGDMKRYKTEYKGTKMHSFTDDSAMTTGVARTVLEARDKNDEEFRRAAIINYKKYYRMYPDGTVPGSYGPVFRGWCLDPKIEPCKGTPIYKEDKVTIDYYRPSCGDGTGMRVSPIGWAYNSLKKTLHYAALSADVSHSDPEGIKGAQAIAAAIYLARAGVDKENIKLYLETKFGYNLDTTLDQYRDYNQNTMISWQQSEIAPYATPMAIRAFLDAKDYDDCIQNCINIGGDVDTIGSMAGAIAGAFYGISKETEEEIKEGLDDHLRSTAKEFGDYLKTIDNEPDMNEIEVALAKARLEKYGLEQYKKDNHYMPNKDPEYLEKLAEYEATRLFCDEVGKEDYDVTKQALRENKVSYLAAIKDNLKQSPEFMQAYENLAASPVKIVDVPDYDSNKRNTLHADDRGIFPATKIEVDHDKLPEKIAEYGNKTLRNIQNPINNLRVINAAREVINLLRSDIRKSDSIFSSDSQEYKNFRTAVNRLSEKLNSGDIKSIDDVVAAFEVQDQNGNSVLACASEYVEAKQKQNDLSERQMDRISICARLANIRAALINAKTVVDNGGEVSFRKDIIQDTVAQKALVGAMKSVGNAEAKQTFRDQDRFKERLTMMKNAFKSESEKYLSELSKKSPAAVAETIVPGTLKKAKKHTEAEIQQATKNMSQSQVNMAVVAQFLLERSDNMISELEANDSLIHSDAYKNLKQGIEKLHESVVGIALKDDFSRESLVDALEQVTAAADIYRIQHTNDGAPGYEGS